MKHPLIFAHRGVKGTHPENTMAAFLEAERVGAHGIELDIHLSNDGEIIVIHDETLNRTTNGTGLAFNYTLQQLKALDAGSFFDHRFAGEQIPSLREVLAWAAGTALLLNIELKNDIIRYPELEQKTVQLVREYGLEDRVIFSSFNHESIELLSSLAPEIHRALLYHEPLPDALIEARRRQASGLHPNFMLLTKEFVQCAQQAGFTLRPYTINEYKDLENMIALGVDVIITDWPSRAFELIKERELL
ncbi:glycerophosphodiester phosphodiesterase [Ectobacillus funiculus]|uniref:glycerophosphodiester phosphodiesterase n=1 Tax=Ectobacillus funiculus TaxID=137993 RepID=UPI00101C0067|nr:glycerophosphodiester phosphodiesterase [Ectobacillus funiculus]